MKLIDVKCYCFCPYVELPQAPVIVGVHLNTDDNTGAVISWRMTYDGNSPLMKYIIAYRQENPSKSQAVILCWCQVNFARFYDGMSS